MDWVITSINAEIPALYIRPDMSFGYIHPVELKCCLRNTEESYLPGKYSDMVPRRNIYKSRKC